MAGLQVIAQTTEVALTAATVRTVIQITAPTNQRVKIKRIAVGFDGTSVTAQPVEVELVEQTSAGTMSSLTAQKTDRSLPETIQTTALHSATAEPTGPVVIDSWEVHPQAGYEIMLPLGDEYFCKGGGRMGIRCTAPAAVNVRAKIVFEE